MLPLPSWFSMLFSNTEFSIFLFKPQSTNTFVPPVSNSVSWILNALWTLLWMLRWNGQSQQWQTKCKDPFSPSISLQKIKQNHGKPNFSWNSHPHRFFFFSVFPRFSTRSSCSQDPLISYIHANNSVKSLFTQEIFLWRSMIPCQVSQGHVSMGISQMPQT